MSGPGPDAGSCELCERARITPWFHEDDLCWVAECEACWVPMVVWNVHDPNPPEGVRVVMHELLVRALREHYDIDEYVIDDDMRSVPSHYHAHARPRGRWNGMGLRRSAR